MLTKGYDLTTDMAKAFSAVTSYNFQTLYGENGEVLVNEIKLNNDVDYKIYLSLFPSDEQNNFTKASRGVIQSGTGAIMIFRTIAYNCVKQLHTVFDSLGYRSEVGGFDKPAGKYTLDTLTVWRLEPVGGIHKNATFFGNKKYGIEQIFNYSIALNADLI